MRNISLISYYDLYKLLTLLCMEKEEKILFNYALNTFYLWLCIEKDWISL